MNLSSYLLKKILGEKISVLKNGIKFFNFLINKILKILNTLESYLLYETRIKICNQIWEINKKQILIFLINEICKKLKNNLN